MATANGTLTEQILREALMVVRLQLMRKSLIIPSFSSMETLTWPLELVPGLGNMGSPKVLSTSSARVTQRVSSISQLGVLATN